MRILLIADMDFFGGTRTYFEVLVDLLLGHGYAIDALLSFPDDDKKFYIFAQQRPAMRWRKLPSSNGIFRRSPLRQLWEFLFLCLALIRSRPECIIVSTGTPGYWLTPLLFPFPNLQILHTVISKPGLRHRFLLPFFLSRLSKKRQIATVSKYAVKQAALHWKTDISYIYNPTPFPEVVNCFKVAYTRRVITAGHVIDYKNPYLWLDVARRVLALRPDASFTWYGDGPLLEEMRRQTKDDLGIQFAGKTYDMALAYAEADIYFQPSLLESHGIAVLEAMSYGLPCVVSDCGGLPESVVHGETGYVEKADDAVSFTERISSLLDNKDITVSFGKNAQQRVREYFMPEHWEKHMLALINEITAS